MTFDLLTWKSIGIIYLPRTIYLPSLKLLGQSILELSVAQGYGIPTYRHTYRPTYRPTGAKQYAPPFSKGGIKIFTFLKQEAQLVLISWPSTDKSHGKTLLSSITDTATIQRMKLLCNENGTMVYGIFLLSWLTFFYLGHFYIFMPSHWRIRGILFLSCLFVNICYNFWTARDRDYIFGIHSQLMTPFQMKTLWPWFWHSC